MDPRDLDDLGYDAVFATGDDDDDAPRLLPIAEPGDDLDFDLDDLMAFEAAEGDPGDDDTPLDRYRAATERLRVLADLARLGIWSDVAAEALPAMQALIEMAVPSPR